MAAMSLDPRIMTPEERASLIKRLAEIDVNLLLNLEEEVVDPYETTLARLKLAGFKLKWPLREVYTPIRDIVMEPEKEK